MGVGLVGKWALVCTSLGLGLHPGMGCRTHDPGSLAYQGIL